MGFSILIKANEPCTQFIINYFKSQYFDNHILVKLAVSREIQCIKMIRGGYFGADSIVLPNGQGFIWCYVQTTWSMQPLFHSLLFIHYTSAFHGSVWVLYLIIFLIKYSVLFTMLNWVEKNGFIPPAYSCCLDWLV